MSISFRIDWGRLYNGRMSFYAALGFMGRHVFVSRWDTVRVSPKPRHVDLWRGREMTWYAGAF